MGGRKRVNEVGSLGQCDAEGAGVCSHGLHVRRAACECIVSQGAERLASVWRHEWMVEGLSSRGLHRRRGMWGSVGGNGKLGMGGRALSSGREGQREGGTLRELRV
ncbi:hypothetical protein CRENBAI_012405 [Crenichthys baileyi]|uniref:Uncharacterized protein n=1 Tax=Crenichthys baileyi TaxID=28760 RepID=A0AAV9R364_9TELE